MMGREEVFDSVRRFLEAYSEDEEWLLGDELMSSGILSSLYAMELIAFLENSFAIEVEGPDLDMANFTSIKNITDLVIKKAAS